MIKPIILCIDDEPMILDSLKQELSQALERKYDIETAIGGEDALELLEELLEEGCEIAVAISDYVMPGMKGDEVLKKIHELSPKTLTIMLTGQASIEGIANAINTSRLYRYLTKPWQNEDLSLTVKEATKSYTQSQRIAAQNETLIKVNKDLVALNKAFSRFVPDEFLKLLNKKSIIDVEFGDPVQRKMSVLFSDIRSFTSLSEKMQIEDNFKFINGYFSRMEPAIVENHGLIDKYIGDAIMALFGSISNADNAVKAGIVMLERLAEYNLTRQRPDRPPIKIGIGINTGMLMLGTVGGKFRMDGTTIGDAVNLASRLEGLTKQYGVSMLISDRTFLELKDPNQYCIRLVDRVQVKGKSKMVSVFEVFDADPPELQARKLATKTEFEQALVFYTTQEWEEASRRLEKCLQHNPEDTVIQIYWQRCQNRQPDRRATPRLQIV
ncbi:MAG: adenylate/guanylate cyclase domain-containing protein [Geitlerinemataceae cyanobacterium]